MTCLILSAGNQSRFDSDFPKQLLSLWDETLMQRQLRQATKLRATPIVITVHLEILKSAPDSFIPEKRNTILHTLRSTKELWGGTVIVLLGDVVFTDAVMESIFSYPDELHFWMTGSEIYALKFGAHDYETILKAIEQCLDESPDHGESGNMRLWHLYRKLNNLFIHSHAVVENSMNLPLVTDDTFDIDSQEHYDVMKKRNPI